MFDAIRTELARLNAHDVQLQSDERLNQVPDSLVKITIHNRSCSVVSSGFLEMLQSLPDGAGIAAIESALEYRSGHAESWAVG